MIKKEQIEERLMYTLKKPHTHDGIDYTQADVDEGVQIALDEEQVQALQDQGIIEQARALKDQGVIDQSED